MKKKRTNKTLLISTIIILLILTVLVFSNTFGQKNALCQPGLFCMENELAYQTLSCEVLVNTGEQTKGICKDNQFNQDHSLVETIGWEAQVPTIVIREPGQGIQNWVYYDQRTQLTEKLSPRIRLSPGQEMTLSGNNGEFNIIYITNP